MNTHVHHPHNKLERKQIAAKKRRQKDQQYGARRDDDQTQVGPETSVDLDGQSGYSVQPDCSATAGDTCSDN